MKLNKTGIFLMCLIVAVGIGLSGCDKKETAKNVESKTEVKTVADQKVLCSMCGEVKGSENCCAVDAEKCSKCELNAGSPACCKHIDFSKGDVALCPECDKVAGSDACCVKPAAADSQAKAQETCPLMGGAIDKAIFADYEGERVYFCCNGCINAFNKEPEKIVAALKAKGVVLDKTPAD